MPSIRNFSLLTVAVIGLSLPSPANAATIPVSAVQGVGLLINFDFTAEGMPPPYAAMQVSFSGITGLDVGETLTLDRFGDLNGTSFLSTATLVGSGATSNSISFTTSAAGLIDGVFSYVLRLNMGTADIASFTASGLSAFTGGITLATVNGTPVPVPEPASMVLLGAGVAVVVARRRLKKRG